jgi:hypothetical protein
MKTSSGIVPSPANGLSANTSLVNSRCSKSSLSGIATVGGASACGPPCSPLSTTWLWSDPLTLARSLKHRVAPHSPTLARRRIYARLGSLPLHSNAISRSRWP